MFYIATADHGKHLTQSMGLAPFDKVSPLLFDTADEAYQVLNSRPDADGLVVLHG